MINQDAIQVLIVDDEPIARDIMEAYVSKVPELQLAGTCKNAIEAFQFIGNHKVDLLLLDINMPQISGVNFLKTLKDPPAVIFTTAYTEYALESYELDAVDYLLKPVSFERFVRGIEKAKLLLQNGIVSTTAPDADKLLFVKSEGKLVRVDLKQLWFVEGLKDYVRLWMDTGKVIVHSTMKSFEDNLNQYPNFTRVHKSYIVNMEHIDEVDGNIILIKKQQVTIGNTYRDEVYKILKRYKLL